MFADKPTVNTSVIKANYTFTFRQLKFCFLFPENEQFFGDVEVLDIGLHTGFTPIGNTSYELTDKKLIDHIYKPRKQFSHKGTYGHALMIAGEKGKMGAAILSTRGCLRAGTGLVTALVPESQFEII